MTEQNNQQPAQQQQPATTVVSTQQPAVVQPQPAHDFQRMGLDQFNARLAAEREAGLKTALAAIGAESLDAAKARLAKAQQIEQSQLTEQERVIAKLKELEPKASRASELEVAVQQFLKSTEESIPESKRALLDLAPTEHTARLNWIANARAKGLFSEAAPSAPQQPANTRAGHGAAPTPATGTKHPTEMTAAERQAALAVLFHK